MLFFSKKKISFHLSKKLLEIFSSDEDFEIDELLSSESEESDCSAHDDIDLENTDVKPAVMLHAAKKTNARSIEPE